MQQRAFDGGHHSWLTSADFRLAFTSGVSANSVCFEPELLDHHRLVFEKEG